MKRAVEQMRAFDREYRLDTRPLGYGKDQRFGVDLGFRKTVAGVEYFATVEAKAGPTPMRRGKPAFEEVTVGRAGAYEGDPVWTRDRLRRASSEGYAAADDYLLARKRTTYFTSFSDQLMPWQ